MARHIIWNLVLCIYIFLIAHSNLSSYVEQSLTMMPFDLSSSVEQICNKVSFMRMAFDSSSSVEQLCDKVLLTRNSFDSILSVEQTCKDGAIISVFTT